MVARRLTALSFILLAALPASANQFISNRSADWYRYTGPGGQDVRSQITQSSGGWRMWDQFAGFGPQWVYTASGYDWFWMWDGSNYQAVANLSGNVGSTQTINIAQNRGAVRVAQRNGTLTTPAGSFTDVTKLTLTTSVADAGVTAIWFAKNVGVVQYETQSIAGPRLFTLASAQVNGRNYPSTTTPPPPPPPTGVTRSPSEHANMEAILWGTADTYMIMPTYEDAFNGLAGHLLSEVAVDSNSTAANVRYELTAAGVPLNDVQFIIAAVDTVWMRDYGPIILKTATGQRQVADLKYYPGRYDDDRFPQAYATYKGWPRVAVNLSYEGGNYACDGRGQGMSSMGVLWFNQGMTQSQVLAEFRKLGCDRVEFFEPLVDEGTTHIDMFARVMSDTQALVSRYPSSHRQYRVTEDAARKMQNLGYQVTRVDAQYQYDEYATYANSVLANGVALIPQYGHATRDAAALQAYRNLGFRAVGVDSRLIITYGGATHCVSMQIPR